jgi:NADH:ubiquinone oxidoreductase subunit K
VAAAEAVVGMAIVLLVYRQRKSIRTEDVSALKG